MSTSNRSRTVAVVLALLCALVVVLIRSMTRPDPPQRGGQHFAGAVEVEPIRTDAGLSLPAATETRQVASVSPLDPRDGRELRVSVKDENESPIAGARVLIAGEFESFLAGETDVEGRLTCRLGGTNGLRVVAMHDEYASSARSVPEQLPAHVALTLRKAGSITGSVVWKVGGEPVVGARVFAYANGCTPRIDEIRDAISGSPRASLVIAETDDLGHYRFEGLEQSRRYSVRAVAEGGAMLKSRDGVRPTAAGIDLELVPFLGAVLHLRGPDGAPLRASRDLYGRGPVWAPRTPNLHPLPIVPPEFYLLTHPSSWDLKMGNSRDALVLFTGGVGCEKSGSVRYDVEVPGYQAIWADIELEPVGKKLPEYTVTAVPMTEEWGQLRIRCSGSFADIVPDSTTNTLVGMLNLFCDGPTFKGSLFIPIRKPCSGDHLVDGLPYGSYSGSFESEDWPETRPRRGHVLGFSVGAHEATVDLEFPHVGSIEVELVDAHGDSYEGEATLRPYTKGGSTAFYSFRRAPYVLDGIEPGHYKIAVERIAGIDVERIPRTDVEVKPADLASVAIHLP